MSEVEYEGGKGNEAWEIHVCGTGSRERKSDDLRRRSTNSDSWEKDKFKNESWQIAVEEKVKVECEGRNDKTKAADRTAWTGERVTGSEKDEGIGEICHFLR